MTSPLGARAKKIWRTIMNSIIYLVGLVVVVMAILSFIGLA
jgi:ABC-type Fe3+-siderophore transport system permease subunit